MSNPVHWFEISVNDINRATNFYEKVFGFELAINTVGSAQMAWFPMEQNGTGATGSLVKDEGVVPSQTGSMVYFSVDDIEGVLSKVSESGGSIANEKFSIGEFGFVGFFIDSEGNKIGLHSHQ